MNVKKTLITISVLIIFMICGIVSMMGQRPSFELIKGNNQPVEYSADLLKINLNSADAEEIESLEGIGHSMALDIIEYREEIGGFTDISQLLEVKGIGEKKLEAIKDDIIID